MTLAADIDGSRPGPAAAGRPAAAAAPPLFQNRPFLLLTGFLLGLALGWQNLLAVWQNGTFFDTDDAMHFVLLRDFLAGQGWFDQTAYRLDPPHGLFMHWTHVLDIPMGLLVRLFELFAPQDTALLLMRIVYPLALQAAFLAVFMAIARRLVPPRFVALAVVLAALSLTILTQFEPGRINHHNAQIVLLLLMLWATLDMIEPERASRGALAGLSAALSLSISIENLPFIMGMIAFAGLAWVFRGVSMRAALAWLGGSLAVFTLAAFFATIAPQRYAADVCDAFGAAHLIGALIGGIGFLLLAAATSRLSGIYARLAAGSLAGFAVLAGIALTFPHCLHDPHSAVDPFLREIWLGNVKQARPLGQLLHIDPIGTLPLAMPILIGLVFAGLPAWSEKGLARMRWLALATFIGIGLVGACWEVRVVPSIAAIAVLGAAWLAGKICATAWRLPWRVAACACAALAVSSIGWAMALPSQNGEAAHKYGDPQACFATQAFTALDSLPSGAIIAPIDSGAYILAFTHHPVFAAPYHRNNHGNRLVVDAFLAPPDRAHDILRDSGARYLAFCPATEELDVYADRAPQGLMSLLRDGKTPAWLEPVAVTGSPYRVYAIH